MTRFCSRSFGYATPVSTPVDNDELVLSVVEDVIRGGHSPTVTSIANATVPKGRSSSVLESLQSLVLRGHLVKVSAILDFASEERASDLDLYYPVSSVPNEGGVR